MSKRNYTQYSNNNGNKKKPIETSLENPEIVDQDVITEVEAPVTPLEIKMEPAPAVDLVAETVETKPIPKTVTGIIANCAKLNIRAAAKADAEILTVLTVGTEVKIDAKKSNRDWFKVCTAAGIEGYCMRKFVNATL